jgi:hypothetical protein
VNVDTLARRIRGALSDDLRRAPWRGSPCAVAGHCYVASEAAWHALGGMASAWRPVHVRHESAPHWFLQHADGRVLDVTAGQFASPVPYAAGRRVGFLTRQPSRRARVVLARIADVPAYMRRAAERISARERARIDSGAKAI